jgi:hypothetical protein
VRRCRKVAANKGGKLSSVGGHKGLDDLSYDGTKSRGLPSATYHGNGDDMPYGCRAMESSMADIVSSITDGAAKAAIKSSQRSRQRFKVSIM